MLEGGEEEKKNKEFMHEKEEKKKTLEKWIAVLLYLYVYDNNYCCVLEDFCDNYFRINELVEEGSVVVIVVVAVVIVVLPVALG